MLDYLGNVLIAVDQLGNTLLGGSPVETISSRAARGTRAGSRGWCLLCKLLAKFQSHHCRLALSDEAQRLEAQELVDQ